MGQDDESFPEGLDVRTTEAGGEVSMSLEETNRVREKLGLKPLRTGESDRAKSKREAEEAAHAARADEAKAKQTAEISARIAAAKERRLMEARDRSTKQLGEADEGDDDLTAWVNKSRDDEKRRRAEERRKAEELARKLAEQDDDAEDSDEDDGDMFSGGGGSKRARDGAGGYTSKDLAGLKVRHDADEVMEGETMILTLKDTSILDDTRTGINEDDDELENVLTAEEKRRKKARKEATKNPGAPFGTDEEEGSKTLLAKYDEKKDSDGLTLDATGAVSAEEERRKAEIRRKLAASLGGARERGGGERGGGEERTLGLFDPRGGGGEGGGQVQQAQEEAPQEASREETRRGGPRGTRTGGERTRLATRSRARRGVATAAAERKRAERDANFVSALNKAKMKTDERILAEMAGDAGGGDEEDDELARALERSRRLAVKGTTASVDALVAAAAERRAKDGPSTVNGDEGIVGVAGDAPDSVVFSDVQEFVHGVNAADHRSAPPEPEGSGDVDDMPPPPPVPPPPPPGSGDTEEDLMDHDDMPPPPPPPPAETARPSNLGGVGNSSAPSKGLAATLALLKDTGKLNEVEMWDGRTNDKKPLALMRAREAAAIPSASLRDKSLTSIWTSSTSLGER